MTKPNPMSLRISQEAREAIRECSELSGLERSAVVETAIREFRARLRRREKTLEKSSEVA